MMLPKVAALDQFAELGECLGVWDGRATLSSDQSIRQPLCQIASIGELPIEVRTIAVAMESQYAIKAAGEAFVQYWNAGTHRKLFRLTDHLPVPLRAWCHYQLGKVYHCVAGAIIEPGPKQIPYLVEAAHHYEQVPRDVALPLPVATPVSGVLTETPQGDLKPLRGQPTPVFLSEVVMRPHRYLTGLYTNLAVRLTLSLNANGEDIRQLIAKAKQEIRARWDRDGVSNHASANFGYFQTALLATENEVEGNPQKSTRAFVEDALLPALDRDGIVPTKRLLWRAGACAVLASVLRGERGVAYYVDTALQCTRDLLVMTNGRARRSLLNDPQFVLARHHNIEFREEFETLCNTIADLDCRAADHSCSSERTVGRSERPEIIAAVRRLNAEGVHQVQIGREVGLSQSQVSRVLQALRVNGEAVRTYARKPKVSLRDPRHISSMFSSPSKGE